MNIKNLAVFIVLVGVTLGCGFSEAIKRVAEDSEKNNTNSTVAEKNSADNSSPSDNKSPFGTSDANKDSAKDSEKTEDATIPNDDEPIVSGVTKTGVPECDEAVEALFEEAVKEMQKEGDSPAAKQIIEGFKQLIYEQMRKEIEKSSGDKAKAAAGCRKVRQEYEKQKAKKQ